MENILSRDQRTTSHRVLDRAAQSYALNSTSTLPPKCQDDVAASNRSIEATITIMINCAEKCLPCDLYHTTTTSYDNRSIRLIRTAPIPIHRFIPTWLKFFLWLSIFAIVLASPMHHKTTMNDSCDDKKNVTIDECIQEKMDTQHMKWWNPCGTYTDFSASPDIQNTDSQTEVVSDAHMIGNVIILTRNALTHATMFRERYIEETFRIKYDSTNLPSANWNYPWLPNIPKKLGEQLSEEYLSSIDIDTALVDAFEYIQKYAMALEQTVWDQEHYKLGFYEQFRKSEFDCRSILCEIHVAILERGLTQRENIKRSVMPSEFRGECVRKNATQRNVRDWICYREYMNGLEYIYQVFHHLQSRSKQM
ncbi:uncharacterized protein [Polyergus mexicanus]|uniref:uncharacterized protein n=1 Tax=Polyergus mexicanus TaxID=615972 RepID=UPI0038B462CD